MTLAQQSWHVFIYWMSLNTMNDRLAIHSIMFVYSFIRPGRFQNFASAGWRTRTNPFDFSDLTELESVRCNRRELAACS